MIEMKKRHILWEAAVTIYDIMFESDSKYIKLCV